MNTVKKKTALFFFLAGGALAGENMLPFATDFEAGTDGWIGSGIYAEEPVRVGGGASGSCALTQKSGETMRTAFVWGMLETNAWYVLTFKFRGKGGSVHASVITERWSWLGARKMDPADRWQTFICKFRTPKDPFGDAFYLQLDYADGDRVWYDGFKLEKGEQATPYETPSIQFSCALREPGEIHFEEDGAPVMKACAVVSDSAAYPLEVRVKKPNGTVVASATVATTAMRDAVLPLPAFTESGYYPCYAELADVKGNVIDRRETPIVVTRRAKGNSFFGMTSATGATVLALRRVGYEWLRGNTTWWMWTEKDGPRVYTGDEPVRKRRPDGFKFLGTTGGDAPDWARGKGRRSWCDDPKKAIPFFEHLLRTTRDVVDQYEIINEPDLVLPREKGVTFEQAIAHYCAILKCVAPVIHAGGRPVAIDVSGVKEGTDFVEGVLKETPESVDIVSLHPYSWPRELAEDGRAVSDPETGGFLDDIRRKRAMMAKYPKKRVVIGELGWALSMDSKFFDKSAAKLGWYLARMYALARSFPEIEYLAWFSLGNTPEHGKNDYCTWRVTPRDGSRPTPAVAAACEAARQLPAYGEGDVEQVRMDGIYLLKWNVGTKTRFAYWTDEESFSKALGPLNAFGVTARSVFGELLDPNRLRFCSAPTYLETEAAAAPAIEKTLLERLDALYAACPRLQREEIAVKKFSPDDWRTYDFRTSPDKICLDTRRDVQPPDPTVQWDGPQDLSAKVLLGWDERNFYFFAAVTDDVHCTPHVGKDIFLNDAVQIAFDTLDNARKKGGYQHDDYEFGMSLGLPFWCWHGGGDEEGPFAGVGSSVTRNGNITEYRAAIPWSRLGLPHAPETLGFAFTVADNDDNARARYYLAFGGGIADGKRPAKFKRLLLGE